MSTVDGKSYKDYWTRTFASIKSRIYDERNPSYKRYGGRGIKCLITPKELKKLWFRDKGYLMRRPSIDRINSKGHYEFKNCRYIELSENCSRNARVAGINSWRMRRGQKPIDKISELRRSPICIFKSCRRKPAYNQLCLTHAKLQQFRIKTGKIKDRHEMLYYIYNKS